MIVDLFKMEDISKIGDEDGLFNINFYIIDHKSDQSEGITLVSDSNMNIHRYNVCIKRNKLKNLLIYLQNFLREEK